MMALVFGLGFVIERIEISDIAVPLFLPVLINQGVGPIWLGMPITVNQQSSLPTSAGDLGRCASDERRLQPFGRPGALHRRQRQQAAEPWRQQRALARWR